MEEETAKSAHVLLLPYPLLGHINPLLQFADRLASHGFRATIVAPIRSRGDFRKADPSALASVNLEFFSDGHDNGFPLDLSLKAQDSNFSRVGSRAVGDLIDRLTLEGARPVCLIYNSFLPWALDVAHHHGILGVTFLTQPCAVCTIYIRYIRGFPVLPKEPDGCVAIPGLPLLGLRDLPSFITQTEGDPYHLELLSGQFKNIDQADYVLVNSFDSLEAEVRREMAEPWSPKLIGPALPSVYIGSRNPRASKTSDEQGKPTDCLHWLDDRSAGSVVYVSFGSLAALSPEQMEEVAGALRWCKWPFLWVVRLPFANQKGGNALPQGFIEATSEQGLVVPWCPQLDVLVHRAVGCFVTHCGWNSTLEGLTQGVPMIAIPQWSDQPTNSKLVSDVWKLGVRAEADETEVVRRGELERCIREVMEGERGAELRRNAERWRDLAREAVADGGSSDNNIKEFVAKMSSSMQDGPGPDLNSIQA
ncbi:UDP-glycosyltransferase 74E1 [Amborella trichopoda]|uniref:UDP-glycosyltransferase 74E1 n=1 Tax=Amborella trichopoda TaxID=13333 RepID=UPI0005D364A0|nr:UDP-glycosyltransferase 74E1 [Amborella trichopoda]|eukprot:XP_011628727.1 UDP-glycosyltransferase 74E1 [Amborella trichopoda]